jgi:hypothetical protein
MMLDMPSDGVAEAERARCIKIAEDLALKHFLDYQKATHPIRRDVALTKAKACTDVAHAIRSGE